MIVPRACHERLGERDGAVVAQGGAAAAVAGQQQQQHRSASKAHQQRRSSRWAVSAGALGCKQLAVEVTGVHCKMTDRKPPFMGYLLAHTMKR